MLRLFRRGGGVRLSALLAAGALGLARPAPAQAPLPGGSLAAAHAVHPSAGSGRLEEIKAELAWIGDSVTFPYALTARARGDSLQVSGKVPSEAVRQHALRVARGVSSRPVQDLLVVQPSLPRPSLPACGEELLPRVRWILSEVLGSRAPSIEVGSRMGGHVVLRGTASSWEEKHTVSVRLKDLRGCASVVNLLDVSGARAAPQPAPPRWHDAKPPAKVMPRASHPGWPKVSPRPTPRLPDVPKAKPMPTPPMMPPIMPPAVRRPTGKDRSHVQVAASADVGQVIATADTLPTPAAPIATGVQKTVSPYQDVQKAVSPYQSAPAPLSAPVVKSAEETSPPVKSKWVSSSSTQKAVPLSCGTPTRDWPTPAQRRAIASSSPPPSKPTMGARVAAWFKGKPKPKPEPEPEPVASTRKKHNGWLAGSRPQFLSARVQKRATGLRSGSAVPDQPYVAKGTVVFSDSPAPSAILPVRGRPAGASLAVPVSGHSAAAPSAARLKQKVLSVCAGQAREVRVEPRPDNSLLVTIKVPDAETEKNLLGRVLQLPEMTAPNVRVFVEVAP